MILIEDAAAIVAHLFSAFPTLRFTAENGQRYVRALADFALEPIVAAQAVEELAIRSTKGLPMIGVMLDVVRKAEEAAGVRHARDLGWRLERLVTLRGRLEDPSVDGEGKAWARDDLSDLVPPITQKEWDEARRVADERHEKHGEQRKKDSQPPPAARPPETYREPPPPSYTGLRPRPGDPAYIVPREEAARRLRAIAASCSGFKGMPSEAAQTEPHGHGKARPIVWRAHDLTRDRTKGGAM